MELFAQFLCFQVDLRLCPGSLLKEMVTDLAKVKGCIGGMWGGTDVSNCRFFWDSWQQRKEGESYGAGTGL